MARRLALLAAVTLATLLAANVQARVGERTTVCASPGLESGSPDECDGFSKAATLTSSRRVVFKLWCLESPGETCRGMVEVPSMTGNKRIRPDKRFRYAVAAGPEGKTVRFRLSRRQVKKYGRGGSMGVRIYAYEPDGRLICSSSEELLVKPGRRKSGRASASGSFPTPDEKCIF